MKQDTITIVCNKCGKTIIKNKVYGYSHACSVYLKEINQHIENMSNYDLKRAIVRLYKTLVNRQR